MRHTMVQAHQYFDEGALDDAEAAARETLSLLPDDKAAQRLLGLIAAARQDFAPARQLLEPLADLYHDDAMVQTAIAETLWATVSAVAAIPYLRRALHLEPARARVRGRLGLALLQAGQSAEARDALNQALAGRPDDADLHLHLALALRDLNETGAAIETLRRAVMLAPQAAHIHTALGEALLDAGDAPAAMAALAEAARRDRGSHITWMLLGQAASLAGEVGRAVECFQKALDAVPEHAPCDDFTPARTALANALHRVGREDEARAEFGRLMHRTARAARPRQLRVGVLAMPGSANTPSEFIIDRAVFSVDPVFIVDGLDAAGAGLRDRFDVLFNAISDPDEAGDALHRAEALCRLIARRVINPPAAVRATTREAMSARLAALGDLIIPRTQRMTGVDILSGAAADLRFPLLLRPVGSHGGAGLQRLADPAELRAAAAESPAEVFYLTEFHHYQSGDGYWRKYRMIFVGGVAYPYHVAIGSDWLNHYFRTETNRTPTLRAEEARFLQHPNDTLTKPGRRALAAIGAGIDLDYFGVDFALHEDGRPIIFECNAAMRVRGARDRDSAKAQAAERIRNAMTQLLTAS
jgi:tetratricopeptide (TPR) repeat protein